jgi:hypothetical protein
MKSSRIRYFYGPLLCLTLMGSSTHSNLQYSKAPEEELKRPNPQGGYGIVWEIDDDDNPALDFSILSFSWRDEIVEKKFLKSPPSDAKTFLIWVHRDFESDNEKAKIIDGIRNAINKKPFRVSLFGEDITGPFTRDGTKYEAMIKLRAATVWNSLDDFAKGCDGVILGKSYVIEGVLGWVISR